MKIELSVTNIYLFAVSAANCENFSECDQLLVKERDSKCHDAVVSDSEVHRADEDSEVTLLGEINHELDQVSDKVFEVNKLVDYEELYEVSEIAEADD